VAVALAASAPLPVRLAMKTIRFGLIFLLLSCAEPTATTSLPVAPPLAGREQSNSYLVNAANSTVYLRLAQTHSEGTEPLHAFIQRMFESADSSSARRLVIDLRPITDGDTRLLVPLIKGIATRDRFVRRGGVYLIVGPNSFSPRQNAARLLEEYASPIFVDEAP
jgi:hypothetical protein